MKKTHRRGIRQAAVTLGLAGLLGGAAMWVSAAPAEAGYVPGTSAYYDCWAASHFNTATKYAKALNYPSSWPDTCGSLQVRGYYQYNAPIPGAGPIYKYVTGQQSSGSAFVQDTNARAIVHAHSRGLVPDTGVWSGYSRYSYFKGNWWGLQMRSYV